MQLSISRDHAEVASLAHGWVALAAHARPFQEFGWCNAWLNTIGRTGGRRPHIVAAWQDNQLVGVLPLVVRRYKGVRLLEWIGAKATDYCDAIVSADVPADVTLQSMWKHLRAAGGFDVWRMGQVRMDARVRPLLARLDPWIETREQAFSVPLTWNDSESWLKAQSPKSRARVRRGVRRMSELGLTLRVWKQGEPLEPVLEQVIQQKQRWIAHRQADSFLIEPQGPQFLRELAGQLAQSGSLHLSCLQSRDGTIVATHLGFFRHGTFYYYIPTYDADYAAQGVGTLLLDSLVRWCCDRGASRFDMLLGAHPYKSSYGAEPDEVQTLVHGQGLLGKVAVTFYRVTRRAASRSAGAEQVQMESESSSAP